MDDKTLFPIRHFSQNQATGEGTIHESYPGVTLREWAAVMAMQGILAGDHPVTHERDAGAAVANAAVLTADALLKKLGEA